MPLSLTLTPTGQRLLVPTSWADVTFAQFVALLAPEPGEPRTIAELLLGLEAGTLNQLAAADVVYLATLLEFSQDPGPVLELLPPPGLPDVGLLPFGCLSLVQQRLASEPERPPLAYLPYVLAVYRSQLTYGNPNRADALEAELRQAPCTACYPEAQAFWAACLRSSAGTKDKKMTTPTTTTKSSMPVSRRLRNDLRAFWRSIRSPKATR